MVSVPSSSFSTKERERERETGEEGLMKIFIVYYSRFTSLSNVEGEEK